ETEAEAVSFVVCGAFGLDSSTRSADYIQLYRGDQETLSESLEFIQETAVSVIEAIKDEEAFDHGGPTKGCAPVSHPLSSQTKKGTSHELAS
ncbi:hypothetical protein OAS39_12180, partial [Pirellulales bacterium]|nr:hypothetical protein [Pirellulales bacterium]